VRHFGSVMFDVADSILNVDERLFRTLGPLYLRPGKLTLDYFEGKRARYVTPFRLVFFLAIAAFFAIQLTVRAGYTEMDQGLKLTTSSGATPKISIGPVPKESNSSNVFAHGNIAINDKVIWNRDTKALKVGWLPNTAVDWLNDRIGNAQQQLYAMNEGSFAEQQSARRKFTRGMFSAAPTVLFLLLPLFALMLKLFYIFKRRLYMEHLIVALHSHAFLCLSLLLVFLTMALRDWLAPASGALRSLLGLIEVALFAWMPIYLLLMQKRVYGQGWIMTLVKYCVLGFSYTILLSLGAAMTILASLVWA